MTKEKKETKETKVKEKTNSTKKTNTSPKVEEEKITLGNILTLVGIVIFILVVLIFFEGTPIWNIVVLLLILTILIFVHEFGHFIVAKKCGVHVIEFALGMGPKVCGFKRKDDPTAYSLRALPIGGYCQMAGEEMEDDSGLPKDKFMCNKSKLQRSAILVAGVTMNFITAIVLLLFISLIWGHTEQKSIIGSITEGSPAAASGLEVGDRVLEFNGRKVSTWDDMTVISAMKNNGDTYTYKVEKKDGSTKIYEIKPGEYVVVNDKTIFLDEENTIDKIAKENKIKKDELTPQKAIGVSAPTERIKGFVSSVEYAFIKFGSTIKTMINIIVGLITGNIGLNALSGPVGMYTVVNTAAQYGIANLIFLMAYLSINLGVMNILPFPAFDGGRLLFVGIEAVTRKKVDAKIEGYFHTIGFILIMLLMLYITFQDILNLI